MLGFVHSSRIPRNSSEFLPFGVQRNGIGFFVPPRTQKRNTKEDFVGYQIYEIVADSLQATSRTPAPTTDPGEERRKELCL